MRVLNSRKGIYRIMFILWFIVPLVGMLWFLNLTSFLKNLVNEKSTHNQTILGAVLTFILILGLNYGATL